jgi:hypothetical protein
MSAWQQCKLTMRLTMKTWENSTSSINFVWPLQWTYGGSLTCSPCKLWIWIQLSDWPPLSSAPRTRAKATPRIQAVQQEEEEDGVEAVTQNHPRKFSQQNQQNRGQQNCQNYGLQNNYRNNQNQQSWMNNNPGNNSNKNKMTCIFCRKQGQRQEECRKRINANQPCLDSHSKSFWPKINTADNDAPIQALQDQDFQF